MKTTRRTLLQGAAFAGILIAAPRFSFATARSTTLRCVMHADLASLDPIATTASITAYHGALIYDTLFGHDADSITRPQMVSDYTVSDDGLTYVFILRKGLKFHDGQPVTARDAVASVKRWGARDGAGQHLFKRVADVSAKDDSSFSIVLNEPYPLILDWLGKSSPSICFIMREADASTDPGKPITEAVGSGPYMFNRTETRTGSQYVYDRNPEYVAVAEPASGFAGGKVAKFERIILQNMPDEQTAVSALQAGEIDFIEKISPELLSQLEGDSSVKLEVLNKTGAMGWLRMNTLQPPFNNVKARQAMLYLIDQAAVMQATFGDPKHYKGCASLFACGTTMESDANTGWFKGGQNIEKAAALFKEAGYDGTPLVIMQQTTLPVLSNASLLLAQWLRQAGVNVELVPLDWAGIVARRSNKGKASEGGWNIFMTYASGSAYNNPIALAGHAATGEKGWFGWPEDAKHEQLRDAWAAAPDLAARQKIAHEMQENAWNFVPHVYLGQWFDTAAMRSDVNGMIGLPDLVPFWNVSRG
ncbi:ABC transporter substrate-binding protein [Aminobacter niigataensis]|uniref:ABC transporter substrate-binding protein n=1 Tax=Aminobacter niigataensis TaxID=83265 RepID=UPI0024C74606|nr:ABC transporter substrate-binding protein [Aminobacter niigataensis]CAI2932571.1 putative peptide ABC transporter periplasmic-binding protein y4tO [Aminobacter niigataensis]